MAPYLKFLSTALVIITFHVTTVYAQTGWKWGIGNTFGHAGPGNLDVLSSAMDPFGNIFSGAVASGLSDTIFFGSHFVFNADGAIIVKADTAGVFQWAIVCGNDSGVDVRPMSMAADGDGNLFVFGGYKGLMCSMGPVTLTNPSSSLYTYMSFLMKISPAGSVLWAKNVVGDCDLEGGMGVDGAGNIYVADDFTQDSTTIGSTTLYNAGTANTFIAKFSTLGDPLWAKSCNSHHPGSPNGGLAVTTDGKIYLPGSYTDTLIISHDTLGGSTQFLAKFDSSGNTIWTKNQPSGLHIYGSTTDKSDNLFLTGMFNGEVVIGTDTLTGMGTNMLVTKVDSSGSFSWGRAGWGPPMGGFFTPDIGYGVAIDFCGNLWVCGSMAAPPMSFSGHILDGFPGSNDNVFIVEYDNSGNYDTAFALKSGGDDYIGIFVDTLGDFYLSGDYWRTQMIYGNDTLANPGTDEALFISKFKYGFTPSDPAPITGISAVCVGSAITLTDAMVGGAWSSYNTSATVTMGVVTGVAVGIDTIKYETMNSCGTAYTTKTVTVNPLPAPGAIIGPDSVCLGASITLSDTITGGFWEGSNSHAALSGGVATGLIQGRDTISYVVSNVCGLGYATKEVTIVPLPNAGVITGLDSVCVGAAVTLADTFAGGYWSSSGSIASDSEGVITGVAQGCDTIRYSFTNSCGTSMAEHLIIVNPLPYAGMIIGADSFCVGSSTRLADFVPTGVWSGSDLIISDTAGFVTGVSPGVDSVTFSVTNVCGTAVATKVITVNPVPDAGIITCLSAICAGDTVSLYENVSRGVWGLNNTFAEIVNSHLSGEASGIVTISYTVSSIYGCTNTSIKVVTINPLPHAGSITGPDSICAGSNIQLSDTAPGGKWAGSPAYIATVDQGLVTSLAAGTDTISYTVTNSCGIAAANHIVVMDSLPDISISRNGNLLSVSSGYASYQWTFNGFNIPGANKDTVTASSIGVYGVIVETSFGCSSQTNTTVPELVCPVASISFYPDPSSAIVFIDWCKPVDVRITCMDGKSLKLIKSTNQVDLSELPNACYVLTLFDTQGNKLKTKLVTKVSK